jgi:hypothetical protein
MWLDDHPYIAIYLVGCLVALVLIVAKATIFSVIDWATKANILTKNLKKLARFCRGKGKMANKRRYK